MASVSVPTGPSPLPVYTDEVQARLANERRRLLAEAGLDDTVRHFRRPVERPFTRRDRDHTTVLIGGLSLRHDALVQAAMEGLGYRVARIPTARKADFQAGKEFGNNGQCNPTYFTVGALVNYLRDLRDRQGLPTEQILDDYAFVTAGACGPCRFGMYEAEYRLALRNSGFDGFRVLLFDQSAGLNQEDIERGFEFDFNFMLGLLNAVMLGDLLNEVAYHIRPYEVQPGQTDTVFARLTERACERLRNKGYRQMQPRRLAKLLARVTPVRDAAMAEKFLDQLAGTYFTSTCREIASALDEEIEVDYTRARPIVKITGEFWAQTTEGDGNFNMFPFLEREGAEVLVEPVMTWIAYMLHQVICKTHDTRGLQEGAPLPGRWDVGLRLRRELAYRSKLLKLHLANRIMTREYERIRTALGGTAHALACQKHLERAGHPYYNTRAAGGEGHLEVAKNIYYSAKKYCHMVLSLKPFGCMPSTQSDGAQAAVINHFADIIFLPIETSGEGDVNAHSRVQMALGEAKVKSRAEFQHEVARSGYTLEEIRAYLQRPDNRDLRRPLRAMQLLPQTEDLVGRAARFVRFVGTRMQKAGVPRTASPVRSTAECAAAGI
jgi:predicted nucleotide-binding protein (sugar kinase/HSP70/actin superfamily)